MSNVASLDNLSGRFSNDGVKVLAKYITNLCNLLIASRKFHDLYKKAKLQPIYKKGSLTEASKFTTKLVPFSTLEIKQISNTIINQESGRTFQFNFGNIFT